MSKPDPRKGRTQMQTNRSKANKDVHAAGMLKPEV